MPFLETYPVRASGPRSDLSFAYIHAIVNAATVTVDATKTSAGYSVARTGAGLYTVTFKKCRFVTVLEARINALSPTTAAQILDVQVPAAIDATTGSFVLQTSLASAPQTPADPAAVNEELDIILLSGF